MNIRTAFVSLALVLASVPAFGQGNHGNASGNGGSNGSKDLSAAVADLQARVARLEGNITAADLAGTYYSYSSTCRCRRRSCRPHGMPLSRPT